MGKDAKISRPITANDIAALRKRIKVGEMVPCRVEIPCKGRGERERFTEEVIRKLRVEKKHPHFVDLSGMGIYRDTTISYVELIMLLRAQGQKI